MRALMHTAFFALISSLLVSMNMAQAGEDLCGRQGDQGSIAVGGEPLHLPF